MLVNQVARHPVERARAVATGVQPDAHWNVPTDNHVSPAAPAAHVLDARPSSGAVTDQEDTMQTAESVALRARALLDAGGCGYGTPLQVAHDALRGDDPLTEHQLDLIDHGATFGLCLALARLDDPFEPLEQVADRAAEATRIAQGVK